MASHEELYRVHMDLELLACSSSRHWGSSIGSSLLFCCLVRRKPEVIRKLKVRLGVTLSRQKVDNERVLDRKDRVVGNVLVPSIKDLGNDWLVAWGRYLDTISQRVWRASMRYVQ